MKIEITKDELGSLDVNVHLGKNPSSKDIEDAIQAIKMAAPVTANESTDGRKQING